MENPTVHSETILRDADNLAVWVYIDRRNKSGSIEANIGLLNAELHAICDAHVSTLDDSLIKKSPRPNPTPRIFIEQGNELSRILWLRWEE